MDEEILNSEIRQFLKKVSVSAKREIEQTIFAAIDTQQLSGNETLPIKISVSIPDLDLHHHISGQIKLS
ncbi:DUF6494 family protein [Methylophaga sp. OBS3]|uniref:DUF6494 family protein n=1 Tax=Methylophaga sp. OBS3 TaxID=2991934 RepID=UPI002259E925|nr:DUF6494 family protein [Methylophaga sp. OBS3]MCX4189233.1 DUF6494 family protein [Methylophaga sp. OBS3]